MTGPIAPQEVLFRYLLAYVVGVSILRGVGMPDFRYGYISITIIQVVYPMLLLLPLLYPKAKQLGYLSYWMIGFAGIVLSEIIGFGRYALGAGLKSLMDTVTIAVFLASFAAIIMVFSVGLSVLIFWRR